MEGLDPSGLRGDPDGALDIPLLWQASLAGCTDWSDQGDCHDARAVRLPPGPRAVAAWFDALRRTPQAGWAVNAKRIYRLYRDLGLQLRSKVPKRRVKAKLRDDRRPAERVNETWAMDFVHDRLATGRKVRMLTIVDTLTRDTPAIEPRFGYRACDVIGVLERVGPEHGIPQAIRVDPGSEFVSRS